MKLLIDILGWIGSIAVLVGYGLNSYQKLRSDSPVFYLLNIVGGILLIVYSYYKSAFANTFINIVWVMVAVPALIKVFLRTKSNS